MNARVRADKQPYVVKLAAGDYYWCACGRSRRPPYCDGSHRGTTCSPVKVEQRQPGDVRLCGCQRSATKPYCDCAEPELADSTPAGSREPPPATRPGEPTNFGTNRG